MGAGESMEGKITNAAMRGSFPGIANHGGSCQDRRKRVDTCKSHQGTLKPPESWTITSAPGDTRIALKREKKDGEQKNWLDIIPDRSDTFMD